MVDINDLEEIHIKKILDEKISILFTSCGIAWRRVGSPYLADLVYTLLKIRPGKLKNYKLPDRHTLADSALRSSHAIFDKKKKKLLENTDSVMMGDGWKNSSNGQKYLVFTLRNVNVDQVFLTFRNISPYKELADNLADWINEAVQLAYNQYGTKVIGITTDNDAKIKAGGKRATNILGEELLTATCFSHSGNLLIKDLVDESFSKQIREFISAFDGPKINYYITRVYGGSKLKNFPDTRFGFMRNTCESILKNINAEVLQQITSSLAETDNPIQESAQELVFDDQFKKKLESMIKLLTPVCKLINTCQDPKKNIADGTELWLTLKLPKIHEKTLQERIVKAVPDIGYAANLVHPKYKGMNLDEDQKAAATNFFKSNLDEVGLTELTAYLQSRDQDEFVAENCAEHPLSYWAIQEDTYPVLSKLCLKVFLFPASTALLEGFFSIWTYLHNRYRNRLSDKNSGLLADTYHMCLHFQTGRWKNTVDNRKKEYIPVQNESNDSDSDDLLDDADDDAYEDDVENDEF